MRSTARRLLAAAGTGALALLALAGPAAAVARLPQLHGDREAVLTTPGGPSDASTTTILMGIIVSLAVAALIASIALLADRRSLRRTTAMATSAESDGAACDDVVCKYDPYRAQERERRAA